MSQIAIHTGVFYGTAALFLAGTLVSLWLFQRDKRRRKSEPPEPFVLLRRPGETLARQEAPMVERMLGRMGLAALGAIMTLILPSTVRLMVPNADAVVLLLTALAMGLTVMGWVVRRTVQDMKKRSKLWLGLRGEQMVGEQLQELVRAGFWVFHDVPVEIDGRPQNLDHVAVGPKGVVVIETKTRGKPKEETGKKAEVRFDGERLCWPFYGDDTATVRQVRRCAKWLEAFVKERCGREVEAEQMIAIPGWTVTPGKFYRPRVVSGAGVSDALLAMLEVKETLLNTRELEKVVKGLEALCRDVSE